MLRFSWGLAVWMARCPQALRFRRVGYKFLKRSEVQVIFGEDVRKNAMSYMHTLSVGEDLLLTEGTLRQEGEARKREAHFREQEGMEAVADLVGLQRLAPVVAQRPLQTTSAKKKKSDGPASSSGSTRVSGPGPGGGGSGAASSIGTWLSGPSVPLQDHEEEGGEGGGPGSVDGGGGGEYCGGGDDGRSEAGGVTPAAPVPPPEEEEEEPDLSLPDEEGGLELKPLQQLLASEKEAGRVAKGKGGNKGNRRKHKAKAEPGKGKEKAEASPPTEEEEGTEVLPIEEIKEVMEEAGLECPLDM